jgi:hypothetical protein
VLKEANPNLRVMHQVAKEELSIVIGNSCDNALDLPLLLAVVKPFKFPEGVDTPELQWRIVSEAATGTAKYQIILFASFARIRICSVRGSIYRNFPDTALLSRPLRLGSWDRASTIRLFSRNRARLLEHDVAREFFTRFGSDKIFSWGRCVEAFSAAVFQPPTVDSLRRPSAFACN